MGRSALSSGLRIAREARLNGSHDPGSAKLPPSRFGVCLAPKQPVPDSGEVVQDRADLFGKDCSKKPSSLSHPLSMHPAGCSRARAPPPSQRIPYILNDRYGSCIPYSRSIAPSDARALGDLRKMPARPRQVVVGRFIPGGGSGRFNLEPRLNIRRLLNDGDDDATNGKASGCEHRGSERVNSRGGRGSPRHAELSGSRPVDSSDQKVVGWPGGGCCSPIGPAGMRFVMRCSNDLRNYEKAASDTDRSAALEHIDQIAASLATTAWQPAANLREEIRQWLGPRQRLAWARRRLSDAVEALPATNDPAVTANRKRWVDFVRTDLGTAVQEYESAPTVAKRQSALGANSRFTPYAFCRKPEAAVVAVD